MAVPRKTATKREEGLKGKQVSALSLFWLFLKIGSTAFGGFMALISVVETAVVQRRRWLRHEDMLDGISLASMLPGPVAVNVVAFVGYRLRGPWGACVTAFAVTLPSFILIVSLTAVYFKWGQVPAVSKLFMGFIPAVTAVIVNTAWGMSQKAIATLRETFIMFAAALLLLTVGGFYITVSVILGAAVLGWLMFRGRKPPSGRTPEPVAGGEAPREKGPPKMSALAAAPVVVAPLAGLQAGVLSKLFFTFAGMSVMLFGGGYVFVPLIQEIVVAGEGWVTQQEFVDAIAMGQITPGPILISAAFIGYKVAGLAGAAVSTVGIFGPPVVIMLLATHALERIKRSPAIKACLRGVRPAVIGMIFAAAVVIGSSASTDGAHFWPSALIFAAAIVALMRFRVDVVWIIPTAGLFGVLLY